MPSEMAGGFATPNGMCASIVLLYRALTSVYAECLYCINLVSPRGDTSRFHDELDVVCLQQIVPDIRYHRELIGHGGLPYRLAIDTGMQSHLVDYVELD